MMSFRAKRIARDFIQALNDKDDDRAIEMLDHGITYVDSRGVTVVGRDHVAELIRRLSSISGHYVQTVEEISMRADEVLISAIVDASEKEFTGKVLIRVVLNSGKIAFYQSYRADVPLSMAMLLVPELARRGSEENGPANAVLD
ncbi:nuclear transport factor 2 family protein [Altererythrobacter sp. SALINAS58]|uniref:nuclear transport factor 2 family protein n=1 Tax=Alteripontixanthobacter muriae TaxID=2705546 RepID=UPI0019D6878B|nr:nuclear transport factor 2 family protein [Alteripontixanthobacter muriae]NTZ42808.1 nuclear transport factor 2 family protein [Alteripontixanthobacter muriae]